jgi:hypothetical protein
VVNSGPPAASDPTPRSDAAPAVSAGVSPGVSPANGQPFARPGAGAAADPNELTPTATPETGLRTPDPNELTPTNQAAADQQPLPPPAQVNEIQQGPAGSAAAAGADASSSLASDSELSSSKKKKKKGIKKIIPF